MRIPADEDLFGGNEGAALFEDLRASDELIAFEFEALLVGEDGGRGFVEHNELVERILLNDLPLKLLVLRFLSALGLTDKALLIPRDGLATSVTLADDTALVKLPLFTVLFVLK